MVYPTPAPTRATITSTIAMTDRVSRRRSLLRFDFFALLRFRYERSREICSPEGGASRAGVIGSPVASAALDAPKPSAGGEGFSGGSGGWLTALVFCV